LRCPYRNVRGCASSERENRELKMKVEFLSKAAAYLRERRLAGLSKSNGGLSERSIIAGTDRLIDSIPRNPSRQNRRDPWPPASSPDRPAPRDPRDRLRWWPWSRWTLSWQGAYNTACLYAALAAQRLAAAESLPAAERRARDERVVVSLERVVNNQYAEMERPYDTVSQDPDFSALRSAPGQFPGFKKFLDDQRRMDYPEIDVAQARLG
jgi:hypothetical protein